jgi:cytochrome bd-type quinol oxidase subunit 2
MSELLDRFSFDASKFNAQVAVFMVIVWLLVLGCAVLSISSQSFTRRQRWFWILTIVCLPVVGLLCYLPFSLSKDRPGMLYRGEHRK